MKLFTALTLFASFLFANAIAQTGPENLFVTLSGGTMQQRPASINIQFLSTGTDAIDVHDTVTVAEVTWGLAALPYTIGSDSTIIDKADSRPSIDKYSVYKMGIYSNHADTITVNASAFFDSLSANLSNNKRISYVYLEDLTTGTFHSILNRNVLLPIPVDTAHAMNYKLHVMVESIVTTTPGNCVATASATVFISNSNHTNWNYTLSHNTHTARTGSVAGDDTTLLHIYPTSYTVMVYTNNLLSDSVAFIVYGPSPITANFAPGSYAVNVNDTVSFTNLSTGAMAYSWSFGDNTTDSIESPKHVFTTAGTFNVTLITRNEYGCYAMSIVLITVNASMNSMQGPSSSNALFLSTPVPSQSDVAAHRTADPTVYTVEAGIAVNQNAYDKQGTIEVRNMNGQLISSAPMTDAVTTIPVNETGIYLVTIVYANGEMVAKKVMLAK